MTTAVEREVLTPTTIGGLVPIRLSEYKRSRKINILIYGDPGVGKTRLAGSSDEIPEFRKVLYLDIEGGSLTLDDCYPNVERVGISDLDQEKQWQALYDVYRDLRDNEGNGYSTVIIDNLSECQKIAMLKVMADAKERANDPDTIEPEVPRQRDWGVNLERMRIMVRAFRDLPMHCIITAHEKEAQNPRTQEIRKMPSLSGKLANEIAGFLDVVVRMYVQEVDGEETRIIATSAAQDYVAKDRSDKLPEFLPNPTMRQIYDRMMGKATDND